MSVRILIAFSVALNLVLVGPAGYLYVCKPFPAQSGIDDHPRHASTAWKDAASRWDDTSLQPATAPFDWNQVESTDYSAYISNLRRIRCPEQTIRDIVMADMAHQNLTDEQRNFVLSLFDMRGQKPVVAGSDSSGGNPDVSKVTYAAPTPRPVRISTPMVMMDPDSTLIPLTETQRATMNQLYESFASEVGEYQNPNDPEYAKRWAKLQPLIDQRLQSMLGADFCNWYKLRASQIEYLASRPK